MLVFLNSLWQQMFGDNKIKLVRVDVVVLWPLVMQTQNINCSEYTHKKTTVFLKPENWQTCFEMNDSGGSSSSCMHNHITAVEQGNRISTSLKKKKKVD